MHSFHMLLSWSVKQALHFVTSHVLLYLLRPCLDATSRKPSQRPTEHWVYPVFALLHYT